MVAMVLAVMVVLLASFELIRLRVADYFEATLRDQYAQQFQLAKESEAERLAADSRFPQAERATLFSTNEQERLLSGIRNIFLVFVLVGFAFSLLLSHVLAGELHAPVLRLREAAQLIGQGDFSARVQIRSRDELGQLGDAFNDMAEGLELKERYKTVLSKVAGPKVADRLFYDYTVQSPSMIRVPRQRAITCLVIS